MWAALAVGAVARGCGGERCAGWTREHGGDLVGMLGRWSSPYIYIYIYMDCFLKAKLKPCFHPLSKTKSSMIIIMEDAPRARFSWYAGSVV
jgi:hypothetical protein